MSNNDRPLSEQIAALFEKINNLNIFNRTLDKRTVIIAFSAIIIVIATISGFFVVKEIGEGEKETSTSLESTTDIPVSVSEIEELDANFLFVLTNDEGIELLSIVGLNSAEEKVRVAFVDQKSVAFAENKNMTLQEHYKTGGINRLVSAISNYENITIHKYLIGDEGTLKNLLGNMGNFTVDVEEKIVSDYKGLSFIIEEGTQTMIPDMMLKYFLYLCENEERYYVKLANVMMLFGERLFALEEDEKVEANLSMLINMYTTDISAVDYTVYKDAVKKLATKEIIGNMIIEGDASGMITTQ